MRIWSLFLVFSLSMGIIGCDTAPTVPEAAPAASEFHPLGVPFPDETVFHIDNDRIHFSLPAPYYLLGIDEAGAFQRSEPGGKGGVTCSCDKEEGGCSPAQYGEQYGWVMTSGSQCTKKEIKIEGGGGNLTDFIVVHPEHDRFIDLWEDLEGEYLLPAAFLEAEEFSSMLEEIESHIYTEASSTAATKVVFIKLNGYIVPLEIDAEIDNTSLSFMLDGSPGAASCACLSGGNCPRNKKIIAVWCDASACQTCALTGVVEDPNTGAQQRIRVQDGRFVAID